jgi:O-acetyl-ADP-ribose deacetylase (regulator of RNase III)
MLSITKGNIFASKCEAICNAVNCIGIMGGGLALAFKKRYPDMFKEYVEICKQGKLAPGFMHVWNNPTPPPNYIINFPTKDDLSPSELVYISSGLLTLRKEMLDKHINSIGIPALGCGLGGLLWEDVLPLLKQFYESFDDSIDMEIYEPL